MANTVAKLSVCIAAPSLDIYGGQSIQAVRLVRALSLDPALKVEFLPQNPRLPWPLAYLQHVKYIRTIVTTVYYLLLLLVRMGRYDIVHVFSASYWSYLLSSAPPLFVARLFRKATVLHYHSGEAEDHLRRWSRTAGPLMKRFDAIVVPSDFLVQVFSKFGLGAESVPNILDIDRFQFRIRAPLRPRFLSCRLLEPMYNVALAIRAFHIIQQEMPGATLSIAADGSQRSSLEQLVTDLGIENVKFLGFVSFDRMPELYDAHDIQLIGNDVDNSPASITESCAAGVLVVSTNAGGIPYIVRHEESALLVECGDFRAMARESLRLLHDPLLAGFLAQNARELVRSYSSGVIVPKWTKLYRQLVRE